MRFYPALHRPFLLAFSLASTTTTCATASRSQFKDQIRVAFNGTTVSALRGHASTHKFYVVNDAGNPEIRVCSEYTSTGSRLVRNTCTSGSRGEGTGQIAARQAEALQSAGQKAFDRFLASGGTYERRRGSEPFVLDITDELSAMADENDGIGGTFRIQ